MTLTPHVGRVSEDGTLRLRSLPAWLRAIAKHKGRDVYLTISRVAEKATHDQHGYYRAGVLPTLAREWGWSDPDELHFWLKEKHLKGIVPVEEWPRQRLGSAEIVVPPSTRDLSREQMAAFVQAVIDHATEEQVAIPPPRGREE